MAASQTTRQFLFLQGPHGPFFSRLASMLQAAGHNVHRVGFNRGDEWFWPSAKTYIPFTDTPDAWPGRFEEIVADHKITDIVLYGDTRQIHAQAIAYARRANLQIHVFEEGYLRPYWITYERDGANGHSRLMQMGIKEMETALEAADSAQQPAPAQWGDMRHHIFYGALYHFQVLARNDAYKNFKPHRELTVTQEFRLYLRRLLLMPAHAVDRLVATRRIRRGGFPYHLVLLQLAHDASFKAHGPFDTMQDFLETCVRDFAQGAPRHHHLVFKAHPLEDGRTPIRTKLKALAKEYKVSKRIHFVGGGKLASLLSQSRTAVTVNSTAGQQALWRGLPLKAFGDAVYSKPEFVSQQELPAFFEHPKRPDLTAYRIFRRFLLETSQIPGGFYSSKGRRHLTRHIVDLMLAPEDTYEALQTGRAAPRQQLQVIK